MKRQKCVILHIINCTKIQYRHAKYLDKLMRVKNDVYSISFKYTKSRYGVALIAVGNKSHKLCCK